jgi:hypothetical protein
VPAASSTPPGCPVCGRPVGREATCPECGWLLYGPLQLGPVTDELRCDFAESLSGAQRAYDAHVAAFVSADSASPVPTRGGRPTAEEWAEAQQAAARVRAGAVSEQTLRSIVADTHRALDAPGDGVGGMTAEIDASGITVTRARLDQFGRPEVQQDKRSIPWTELLPMLSADTAERHFQLAGGLSGLDRTRIWEILRREVPERTEGCTLVICWPAGWRILEQAALQACRDRPSVRLIRAVAPNGATMAGGLVRSVASDAPLSCTYVVPVAVADPLTGEVRLEHSALFGPGTRAGAESSVALRRVPGDRGDIAVAVMTANGQPEGLLSLHSIPQPSEPVYQLRAVLDGPGQVTFTEPASLRPDSRPWPEILAGLPSRVDVSLGPVDLVCAMELSGPRDLVRQRRELVRDLLEILDAEYPEQGRLRVALAGCTDHLQIRGREKRNVVRSTPLGPVSLALTRLGKEPGSEVYNKAAAPLEDLLHEAAGLLGNKDDKFRAARLLLVVGRPPHPHALDRTKVHPCPHGYNWRAYLRWLTGTRRARCVAVVDSIPGYRARAAIWHELGPSGLHELSAPAPAYIGEDLGVLVRHAQRIPIPLANLEAGER